MTNREQLSMTTLTQELRKIPYLRFLFSFLAGVIVQIHLQLNFSYFPIVLLGFFVLLLFIRIWKKVDSNFGFDWIFGALVHIALFFGGVTITTPVNNHTSIYYSNKERVTAIANIVQQPIEKANSYKVIVELKALLKDSQWINVDEKALFYFEKDSLVSQLSYGDQIIINSTIEDIKNSNNPHEFDYKKFLSYRRIHLQSYVESVRWQFLQADQGYLVFKYSNLFRQKLLQTYNDYGISGQEFQVLAALTLGYKDELDETIKFVYSGSGSMHVLAVSGLHVGVVFWVLNYFLFFFNSFRFGKFFKALIIIVFLISFAFITGLSPSVVRAVFMFSLIVIANSFNRSVSIYNTLAISAFFITLYNPYIIMEVGFQLSYLAVLSIVYFQPKIYKIWSVSNKILDKIWGLLTVAIAAQIGTAPLGIYYFHQFANYFWLANLVVIPLAMIIIYVAITFFLVSFIQAVAAFFAFILNWLVKILNMSVAFIMQLPYSVTENISFDLKETILAYMFIICSLLYLIYNKKVILKVSLVLALVFLSIGIASNFSVKQQRKVVIYNARRSSIISFTDGTENLVICDSVIINDIGKLQFVCANDWLHQGLSEGLFYNIFDLQNSNLQFANPEKTNIFNKDNFIRYYDKTFLILTNNEQLRLMYNKKLDVDYIILADNVIVTTEKLLTLFNFKQIILDSSNSEHRVQRWLSECDNQNINCYSIARNGAFILNL